MRYRQYEISELVEKISAAGGIKNPDLLQRVAGLAGAYSAPVPTKATPAAIAERQPLWKVYTPTNIYREIRYRLAKAQR
jgi:hypothetical protein